MRRACIDIGSNTTRLLVADADPAAPGVVRALCEERVFARLPGGPLAPERIAAVAAAVAAQLDRAREHGADARVVATGAVRDASNGAELCAHVRERCGVEVEVLSGAEEARLAFAGATAGLPAGAPPVAVVDVGGASTEVACGRPGSAPAWSVSLPIGSGRLTEAHLPADPPGAEDLAAARAAVAAAFAGIAPPPVTAALAVGGSAGSMRRLAGAELDAAALAGALRRVVDVPSGAAAGRLGLHPERVRLLPAGILLLAHLAALLGVPLRIARGGLREGVILTGDGQGR